MIKNFIICIVILFFSIPILANEDDKYIEKETSDMDKLLKKGEFVTGFIYFQKDTIQTELFMFKGKAKKNSYLFCISRSGKDKIKIFKANEIYGYKIMNDYYVQHMSDGNYFFIRKTKTGKIDLFEREIIPSDNRFLYLLKFPNNNSYFVINPTENNITEQRMPDTRQPESSGATVLYIASKGINEKFKIFVSIYLGDCYQIKNMVNSEFYTIKDIPIIIETYNNCLN